MAPGLTDTARSRYRMIEDAIAAYGAAFPAGPAAAPREIADGVVFLASVEASFMIG